MELLFLLTLLYKLFAKRFAQDVILNSVYTCAFLDFVKHFINKWK